MKGKLTDDIINPTIVENCIFKHIFKCSQFQTGAVLKIDKKIIIIIIT